MITTSLSNYLEKSLDKVWNALSFANEHTQGGLAKLRQAKDTQFLKRASTLVKDSNGITSETGWMSQIEGVVAETDAKIRKLESESSLNDAKTSQIIKLIHGLLTPEEIQKLSTGFGTKSSEGGQNE